MKQAPAEMVMIWLLSDWMKKPAEFCEEDVIILLSGPPFDKRPIIFTVRRDITVFTAPSRWCGAYKSVFKQKAWLDAYSILNPHANDGKGRPMHHREDTSVIVKSTYLV